MTESGARHGETAQHESREQQLSTEHTERAQTELKESTALVIESRVQQSDGENETFQDQQ